MKRLLFAFILLYTHSCMGQNYQCLQSNLKHYFINGNGYLRGIRIDSVITYSDSIIYYPFHTPRGAYSTAPYSTIVLDSNGGSWLGKRVKQLNDGTFIFDNYWGNAVTIKTQATVGDTWTFYRDSSNRYYRASILAIDTQTVLASIDSVKTILINAYYGSVIDTSDPLDSLIITLSKNSGFFVVPDLYTFPYHKPDSVYRLGLDFYLDRSTCKTYNINSISGLPITPNPQTTLFTLVDFINPNERQLRNWDVGDVIESSNITGVPIYGTQIFTYLIDTVISKVTSGSVTNYVVSGSTFTCPTFHPCSLICSAGAYSFSDLAYPILDTSLMPESSQYNGDYIFYYPHDSSHCSTMPLYTKVKKGFNTGGLGSVVEDVSFKLGIGKTEFHHRDGDPVFESDYLLYYSIHGTSCRTPLIVEDFKNQEYPIVLSPNPGSTEITISAGRTINQLTVSNFLGSLIHSAEYSSKTVRVNISSWPSGLYFVKVNGNSVTRFVKQ